MPCTLYNDIYVTIAPTGNLVNLTSTCCFNWWIGWHWWWKGAGSASHLFKFTSRLLPMVWLIQSWLQHFWAYTIIATCINVLIVISQNTMTDSLTRRSLYSNRTVKYSNKAFRLDKLNVVMSISVNEVH